MPPLITKDTDQDAQAALQHVVMTYSPVDGRHFYVNGVDTGDTDKQGGGNGSWNSTHASRGCSQPNLVATGGAGLLYCFASN
jgi:hypothetical protein